MRRPIARTPWRAALALVLGVAPAAAFAQAPPPPPPGSLPASLRDDLAPRIVEHIPLPKPGVPTLGRPEVVTAGSRTAPEALAPPTGYAFPRTTTATAYAPTPPPPNNGILLSTSGVAVPTVKSPDAWEARPLAIIPVGGPVDTTAHKPTPPLPQATLPARWPVGAPSAEPPPVLAASVLVPATPPPGPPPSGVQTPEAFARARKPLAADPTVAALVKAAREDADPAARAAALRGLGALGAPTAEVLAVAKALQADPHPRVRYEADKVLRGVTNQP